MVWIGDSGLGPNNLSAVLCNQMKSSQQDKTILLLSCRTPTQVTMNLWIQVPTLCMSVLVHAPPLQTSRSLTAV